jgi:hypothetical protein
MANRQQSGDDSPRQGNRDIPEMDDSSRSPGGEERLRSGSDEEISSVADDDSDEFEDTDDLDTDDEEEEDSI